MDYLQGGRLEVAEHALAVEPVLALGLYPDLPAEQVQELALEQVDLLQGDSPDVSQVVVPVEDVIVKLRGHKNGGEDESIKHKLDMFLNACDKSGFLPMDGQRVYGQWLLKVIGCVVAQALYQY